MLVKLLSQLSDFGLLVGVLGIAFSQLNKPLTNLAVDIDF